MRYDRDGFSVEAAIRKGRKLPSWYLDEPILESTDVFYLKAFYDLGTCRLSGMSIGSIPWTAMVKYAAFYELDRDVTEAFVDIMRTMDASYVDYVVKEQKRLSNQK